MRLREPEDEHCVSAVLIHIVHKNTYPLDILSLAQPALHNMGAHLGSSKLWGSVYKNIDNQLVRGVHIK